MNRIVLLALLLCSCAGLVRARGRGLERKLQRAGLHERMVAIANDRVHVWEGGEGPTVVLLHGLGPAAAWQWHAQVPALAKRYRVVMPDLVHFGESTSTAKDFGVAHQVETMGALLRALEVDDARVVGLSYGGFVAWDLAREHPELVARVVLVDSAGPAFDRAAYEALLDRFHVRDAVEIFVPEDDDDMKRLVAIAYADPPPSTRALRDAVRRELYLPYTDEQTAIIERLVADREASPPELAPLPQPVALVWGAHDPVFPIANAQLLARIVDTRVLMVDDARHAPNLEHPRRFTAKLLEALR